jgi:hypothetical protein
MVCTEWAVKIYMIYVLLIKCVMMHCFLQLCKVNLVVDFVLIITSSIACALHLLNYILSRCLFEDALHNLDLCVFKADDNCVLFLAEHSCSHFTLHKIITRTKSGMKRLATVTLNQARVKCNFLLLVLLLQVFGTLVVLS